MEDQSVFKDAKVSLPLLTMVTEDSKQETKRFCLCGKCGEYVSGFWYDSKTGSWIRRRFKQGHHNRVRSENTRAKMSVAMINKQWNGPNSPLWKGDSVGIDALHTYIRKHRPRPELCESCKLVPPLDLANITGIYNRNLNNWKWFCRRCHMLSDGRMQNLKQYHLKIKGVK